jgi:hypothetical protein
MYLPVMPDLKPVLKPRVFSLLTRVSGLLTEQGIAAYLIGGLVRDMLLERNTADIDIAVAADALKVAPKLAGALGGKYVLLDGVNRIGRVVLAPGETSKSSSASRNIPLLSTRFTGKRTCAAA